MFLNICQFTPQIEANQHRACQSSYHKYSKNLGIAFQIIDDILDCTGNTQQLGKNTGSDIANNKATFVSILGINKSLELAKEYTEKAKHFAKRIDKTEFLLCLTDYLLNRKC